MRVQVNGEDREIADGARLEQLLDTLGVERSRVAVELNSEVVRRARHAEVVLKPGDQIEIVSFVGGG
jgi:sulfur carrier protein